LNLVLDASVAVKLVVLEDGHLEAKRLVALETNTLVVPEFLMAEAGNVLWKKARRKEISADQVRSGIADFRVTFTQLVPIHDLIVPASEMSLVLDHPIYDCLYLACAQRADGVVVTADKRLQEACSRGGLSDLIRGLGSPE
jgi:predicted nucleic acid-binding protein